MSTILIDRLCDIVAAGEMSRAGLARAAGLHPNSLRKLGDADWNPTADTLLKLEPFLASGVAGVLVGAEADHRRGAQRPDVHPGRRRGPRE